MNTRNNLIVSESVRKKWQIALRRYILERQKVPYYAPYFGIDIEKFRSWVEIQFENEMSWQGFGSEWHLDHVIPVSYFDFTKEADLKLCWNFINIKVQIKGNEISSKETPDLLTAKAYFLNLYTASGNILCLEMIKRIEECEDRIRSSMGKLSEFFKEHRNYMEELNLFGVYEFEQLNSGVPFESVKAEYDLLAKFKK